MPMNFKDRVINIDVDVLVGVMNDQRGLRAQTGQGSRGDGVKLTDMTEREGPQERAQGRRCVPAGEDRIHATVAQQIHVVDGIGTSDHSRHQRGNLHPRVGTLVRGHTEMFIDQGVEVCSVDESEDRDKAGGRHEIRIVESH